MIEMVVVFAVIVLVSAHFLGSLGSKASQLAKGEKSAEQLAQSGKGLSDDTVSGNEFLAQLQREIELTLFPRPTDSVLKRHYDSLVASKLGERLAKMPN